MECYPTIKKEEILPFLTTQMNLEGIILSDINQTIYDDFTYMWNTIYCIWFHLSDHYMISLISEILKAIQLNKRTETNS